MAANEVESPKIGAGHASAMFRQGLKELRGALYPESNVAQHQEYGLYGTRTPGEVAEARRSDERDLEEEPQSVLADRLERAEQSKDDRGREPKEPERDR